MQKSLKKCDCFLVETVTPKSPFEINWPLASALGFTLQSVSQYVLVEAHTVCVSYHRSCKVLLKNRPRFALIASASLQTIFAKYIQWKYSGSAVKSLWIRRSKFAKNIDEELARSKCFLFELWKYHLTFRKSLSLIDFTTNLHSLKLQKFSSNWIFQNTKIT